MGLLRHHQHLVPTPLATTIPLKHPDTVRLMVLAMAHLLHPMVPRACRRTGAKRKASGVHMCLPTEGVNATKCMRLQLLGWNRYGCFRRKYRKWIITAHKHDCI